MCSADGGCLLVTYLACVNVIQQVPGNKMDSSNLATVFGPTVLRRGKTGSKFQLDSGVDEVAQNADVVAVVKDLIDFHAAVFRVRLSPHSDDRLVFCLMRQSARVTCAAVHAHPSTAVLCALGFDNNSSRTTTANGICSSDYVRALNLACRQHGGIGRANKMDTVILL